MLTMRALKYTNFSLFWNNSLRNPTQISYFEDFFFFALNVFLSPTPNCERWSYVFCTWGTTLICWPNIHPTLQYWRCKWVIMSPSQTFPVFSLFEVFHWNRILVSCLRCLNFDNSNYYVLVPILMCFCVSCRLFTFSWGKGQYPHHSIL